MRAAAASAAALLLVALPACGRADPAGDTVRVFASASLTEAFEALAAAFEATHEGVDVELQLAGTPVLVAQLERGAPADVFASADEASMARVAERVATAGTPRVFATNSLELVVAAGNPEGVTGLTDLARRDLVVALAAAEVPAGRYAREALARAGVEARPDTLEPSVKAIVTKVALGEVDAGVVYRTDVRAAGDRVEGVALPPAHDVEAVLTIAVLGGRAGATSSERRVAAAAFVDFVLSSGGRRALAAAGFGPPGARA